MALSGSQKAPLQARSGIARSGATRSNYYAFSVVITIDNNGTPVDVSKYVAYNGWHIALNLNEEIDTASLSLLPTCPFVPQTRSQIKIGFGSIGNLQFAGIVLTVQRTRRTGPDPRFWYDITCVDWTALLDAHLIVTDVPTQSATTTIVDLVARFAKGSGITTAGVAQGLPSNSPMSLVNERLSTVIRRVVNKVGGGFYVDCNRVLRAWSSTIPSPIQEVDPQPLTDHLPTLKSFRMTEDASQQRTRVFVEGRGTTTVLGLPVGAPSASVPLRDGGVFPPQNQIVGFENFTRIGSLLSPGPQSVYDAVVDASNNPPGTKTVGNLAIGANQMTVEDDSLFPSAGWLQVAGQALSYQKTGGPQTFWLQPSGYGSLAAPVTSGAQVILLSYIGIQPVDRLPTTPGGQSWFESIPMRAQPQGSTTVVMVLQEDPTAANTIATREGSDGYYEHIVTDGRYSADGCRGRAQAELADFKNPLLTYEWETEDQNAQPGRMQTIALTEGTPVSDTVRITNVEITPTAPHHPPRRVVKASKVITAGVVDIWVDDAS